MTDIHKVVVALEAESSKLRSELQKTQKRFQRWEKNVARSVNKVKNTMKQAVAAFVGFQIGQEIGNSLKRIVTEASNTERQLSRLEAQVKQTGMSAGLTAKQIDDFARGLARETLANTQQIRDAASGLLTFKSVAGETFKETLRLAQDLAEAGFGDVRSQAVKLGKALADPARRLSELAESGITFSKAQEDLIKTLAKSGRLFEAQGKLLEVIREQVGGAGKGAARGLAGSIDGLAQSWGEFLEKVGESGPILALGRLLDGLATRIDTLKRLLFADERERFFDLADRAIQLRRQIREIESGGSLQGRAKPMRQELERIQAEMRALQDANINRIKAQGAAAAAAGKAQVEAAMNAAKIQDDVLKKLQKQGETFKSLVAETRKVIQGEQSNPLTKGTLVEVLRALEKAKTLEAGGDTRGAFEAATKTVEQLKALSEAGGISKQFATSLLEQAAAIGGDASSRMIELKLDDETLRMEAERARKLIQDNFSAKPFDARIAWSAPDTPASLPADFAPTATRAGGQPIILNFPNGRAELSGTPEEASKFVSLLEQANLAGGAK